MRPPIQQGTLTSGFSGTGMIKRINLWRAQSITETLQTTIRNKIIDGVNRKTLTIRNRMEIDIRDRLGISLMTLNNLHIQKYIDKQHI